MKPQSILETALYVADLDVSEAFYRDLFQFPTLIADERMRALKIVEGQMLLLFKLGGSTTGEATAGGFIPPHDGRGVLHLAFRIGENEIAAWRENLKRKNVEIESEVEANGGHSIYFRDPDGHCLELGTAQLWNVG
ncbi:MAG: VOC family protein [Armatimonadetes bacterium]|nr:VOC family protein [Armatimonadota bacterium]